MAGCPPFLTQPRIVAGSFSLISSTLDRTFSASGLSKGTHGGLSEHVVFFD